MLEKNSTSSYPWIDYVLDICTGITHFIVNGVKVFIACNDMEYPADTHVHNDLEFMCVKRQTLNDVVCNDKILSIPINHILPIMPMQRHGCAKPITIKQYIAFAFPPEFYLKFKDTFGNFNLIFKNIPFEASAKFDYLVGYLFEEYSLKKNEVVMQKIIELIFLELYQCYINTMAPITSSYNNLEKAKSYLDKHLNLPFNLDETAKVANISKFYFCRKFKESFGLTPSAYLNKQKVNYAKLLISTTNKSFTKIAIELGFNSSSHFAKQFKSQCGVSPKDYKKTILK